MKKYIDRSTNCEHEPISVLINFTNKVSGFIYVVDGKKLIVNNNVIIGEIFDDKLVIGENTYDIEKSDNGKFIAKENNAIIYTVIPHGDYELKKRIKRQKIAKITGRTFMYIFLFVLAITVLFPFYWMINTSLKNWQEFSRSVPTFWPQTVVWHNYVEAFEKANLGYLFINTLYVGIVSTLLSLVVTVFAAFAFARLEFPGRDTIFAGLLATMMIPGEMFTITNYATVHKVDQFFARQFTKIKKAGDATGGIFGRLKRTSIGLDQVSPLQNWLYNLNLNSKAIWVKALGESKKLAYEPISFSNTYAALIIPFLVSVFYIYLLRQNFKQIPDELYLAAKVDGTSDFGYLLKIMVPLSAPTLVTITILKMMGAWNSYVWPRLVANTEGMKLITNGIRSANFQVEGMTEATNFPLQMAAITIVTLPLFAVFLCFRKYIMRGVSKSGTKG